ncbi:MAG TPA: FtsX-like permease family protein, partial [Tepidiformaceae bacterium]|nr:FtsX-like permease family protein [Tepidiformaceae bacterium]
DLPDTRPANPETATLRGYLRGALNGFAAFGIMLVSAFAAIHFTSIFPMFIIAAVCALPGPWLAMLRGHSFGAPAAQRKEGERVPRWPFIVGVVTLPIVIGAVILLSYSLALLLVRFTRERPDRELSIPMMLAGIVVAPLGVFLAARQDRRTQVAWSVGLGCVGLVLGILLTQWSLDARREWMFATGVSLMFFWAAATLRYFRIRERLSFTVTSLALLVFWYLAASAQLEWLTGKLKAGPEMLFFSGLAMVIAGTFVIVYNADIVLPMVERFGNRFGRVLPAVKTAIAYPLTSRFRTGITIAMIALIMFIVSMMAAFNSNFAKSFNNDASKGGYDIRVEVNPNNPSNGLVGDLNATGRAGKSNIDTSKIAAVGENRIVNAPQVSIRDPKLASDVWKHYTLIGADAQFIDSNQIALQYRASGYATDKDVWQALKSGQDLAIIPSADALSGGGFGGGTIDDPIKIPSSYTGDGFTPFKLQVQASDGAVTDVTVIGQFKNSSLAFWPGILLSKESLLKLYPDSKGQTFFVRLAAGTNAGTFARQIEASLPSVSADTTSQVIDDNQTINRVFLDVFEGFLALGLIVGIAALGVIAFRSVVERRQQIGMLRAIGYQRRMVELSFLFESGFIALSGIGLGLVLGLSLAWSLFTSGALGETVSDVHFTVPWLQVGAVTIFALVASLVMAWLPARAALRVPVAEALRYE